MVTPFVSLKVNQVGMAHNDAAPLVYLLDGNEHDDHENCCNHLPRLIGQNSCSRLAVEQSGLQNLVKIDIQWNQQVTRKSASSRRPLSVLSTSKVAFSGNFGPRQDFQFPPGRFASQISGPIWLPQHSLVEKPDFHGRGSLDAPPTPRLRPLGDGTAARGRTAPVRRSNRSARLSAE
jgi:hypothetical protein